MLTQRLKERLNGLGVTLSKNINKDELQGALAPALRSLTTQHLGCDSFAVLEKELRAKRKAAKTSFTDHKLNEAWETDIQIKALAELLGCHLIVTAINNKTKEINTRHIKRAEQDDSPIIHLRCKLDPWSYNSKNFGDNDDHYFYNAMASALNDHFIKNIQGKENWHKNNSSNFKIRIVTDQNERLELYNQLGV